MEASHEMYDLYNNIYDDIDLSNCSSECYTKMCEVNLCTFARGPRLEDNSTLNLIDGNGSMQVNQTLYYSNTTQLVDYRIIMLHNIEKFKEWSFFILLVNMVLVLFNFGVCFFRMRPTDITSGQRKKNTLGKPDSKNERLLKTYEIAEESIVKKTFV